MNIKTLAIMGLVAVLVVGQSFANDTLVNHMQDISVTIKAPGKFGDTAQGSGVIITRQVKRYTGKDELVNVNFVWTAAHVVDNLRSTRSVIDPKTGSKRVLIEFAPAHIVKELTERGRRVGEVKMEAVVVKYSDADHGEDLALLMVRKTDFIEDSARFYLGDDIVPIGTKLFHVGSLLGQVGANSMTDGILSQIGRVLDLGNRGDKVFDQTTVNAFPGSSGGGVFIAEGDHKGEYMGMLVRGAGETFNLVVPVRRMQVFAERAGIQWALDSTLEVPALDELKKIPVEDLGVSHSFSERSTATNPHNKAYPYLLHTIPGPVGDVGKLDVQHP